MRPSFQFKIRRIMAVIAVLAVIFAFLRFLNDPELSYRTSWLLLLVAIPIARSLTKKKELKPTTDRRV